MKRSLFKEYSLIVLLFAFVLALCFSDVVFSGHTFKIGTGNPQALYSGPLGQEDNKPAFFPVQSTTTSFMEEPMYAFIKGCLREGFFPLWNPHQGCGYPFISMMHLGFFWPLNFLLYFLPSAYGWDALILCRFLLAGLFTYLFMRGLRFGRIPSFGAGVCYMLSGPMVVLQYGFANVEILTPLLLLFIERLIRSPDNRRMGLAAAGVAMTFYAGHPEHVLLVNGMGFLYFWFRSLTVRPRPRRAKAVLRLGGAYALGIGLGAAVFFPFLRDWLVAFWHAHQPFMGAEVEGQPIIRESVLGFFFPHFVQDVPVTLDFSRPNWWGYIGIFPSGLAAISLVRRQRQGLNYFFAAAVFLLFAKNYLDFPLTNWVGHLPVLRILRFYFHTPHLFAFSFSILAGMGIRVWMAKRFRLWPAAAVFSAILLALALEGLVHYRGAGHFMLSVKATVTGLIILAAFNAAVVFRGRVAGSASWIIVFLLLAEIFLYIPGGRVKRYDSFPRVPYIERLKTLAERERVYGILWTLYPNTATGYRIDDLSINQGLLMKRFVEYVNEFIFPDYFDKDTERSAFFVVPLSRPSDKHAFLDILNLKYTVSPSPSAREIMEKMPPLQDTPIYSREVNIYRHNSSFPRAFIVHRAVFVESKTSAFNHMKRLFGNFSKGIVVTHPPVPAIIRDTLRAPLKDNSKVTLVQYSPNEVVLAADMENSGFVVLADTYHPDWRAALDGKETRVFPANHLLRAVFVPSGTHVIRFRFVPVAFYWGIAVSFLSLLALTALLTRRPRRHY